MVWARLLDDLFLSYGQHQDSPLKERRNGESKGVTIRRSSARERRKENRKRKTRNGWTLFYFFVMRSSYRFFVFFLFLIFPFLFKKRNENEEKALPQKLTSFSSFVFISFFLEKESNFFSFIIFLWTIKP